MSRPVVVKALWGAAVLVLVAGCSSGGTGGGTAPPTTSSASPSSASPSSAARVSVAGTLTEGLKSPWGLAELPGGDLLVSSRDERTITRIDGRTGAKTPLGEVPGVVPGGEGGLLGLAVRDGWVYAYLTAASDNRVVRMRYGGGEGDRLGPPEPVLTGIPKGSVHNGGRIAFGPDGMLYAGTGETGRTGLAQDRSSLGGKILRMTPEGRPRRATLPGLGGVLVRAPQRAGLAWDPAGRLWASEFGQNTWDELNLIEPGRNYGWPLAEGRAGKPGLVDPVAQWPTSEASPAASPTPGARSGWPRSGASGCGASRSPGRSAPESPRPPHGHVRTPAHGPRGGRRAALAGDQRDRHPGHARPGDDRILRLDVK
ncbi:PQQ-dependent sugar dehydrogenase [Streptomyces diastatochromogenes]|nr:PQQ-dependent sugar dehydrogenase [Streptomyces diastatochromogenes]